VTLMCAAGTRMTLAMERLVPRDVMSLKDAKV